MASSTTEFQQTSPLPYYALDLPGTDVAVKLEHFAGKSGVLGQFAIVERVGDDTYEAARDPLGIGKLFYTQSKDGRLHFSDKFVQLLVHETRIYALPRGQHVRLGPTGTRQLIRHLAPSDGYGVDASCSDIKTAEEFHRHPSGQRFKEQLAIRLDVAFRAIQQLETAGFKVLVALSGGLDSSVIAAAARQYLRAPLACTLDLGRSEDAEKSALIANALGIEQVVFQTSEDEVLEAVGQSPSACQDYRDFNVHCTALNLLLAKNMRSLANDRGIAEDKVIVLTGDTMNEFTCDYAAEIVDGKTYYRLPRVGKKALQQSLVGGLDTSDRELSPFSKYRLSCIQPYAVAYDLYLGLPENVLQLEDVKKVLNGHLVPAAVLQMLPKSKLRAQVGSKESMGVLGLCHRRGIDEGLFLKQLLLTDNPSKATVPITMGRYEVEAFDK